MRRFFCAPKTYVKIDGNPVDAGLMTKILERVYPDGRGVGFSCVLLKLNENTNYSKTCLKRLLKIDKTKVLKTNGSLMNVESMAECSKRAFCNTFDLHSAILLTCIKRYSVLKTHVWSSFRVAA